MLAGFVDESTLGMLLRVCPFLYVTTTQGQGKEVAGRGQENEAKVRAEGDMGLNDLPQVPTSGASSVQYKAGTGCEGQEGGQETRCVPLLPEVPVEFSHQLSEGAIVICNLLRKN